MPDPLPTFAEFETRALNDGCDAALERSWAPGQVVDPHSHPFKADALVVAGEMWLAVDGQTQHLRAGDRFSLAPDQPHSERYGPQGATYWVARRHTAATAG